MADWQNLAELAGQYGFSAQFFGSDLELANLIQQAVYNQWDTQQFQARFMNTNWYRAREASVRQWADLETRDPAEATSKINQRAADFSDALSQYGVTLDQATVNNLARSSLQYAWSSTQTKDIFANFANVTPGQMAGTPAAIETQVNKLLGDYGVTATNSQKSEWVSGMLHERYTEDNLRDTFRDMAKSKYPGMGMYLDQGQTVRQIASPYVQSYSHLLEVDSDAVDLNDNLVQQALQGVPPAPNQPPQMQSVYQFERALRRDPRWVRTKNARDSITSAGQSVLRDWGLVG